MGTATAKRKFASIITAILRTPPFQESVYRSIDDEPEGTECTRHFELHAMGQQSESLFDGVYSSERWTPELFQLRMAYICNDDWETLESDIQTDIEAIRDALINSTNWGATATYSIVAVLPQMNQRIDFARDTGRYIVEFEWTAWIAS